MKIVCPECSKEFEINLPKALAYSLNGEDKPKCDKCIFDNIFSKLDKDFGIDLYDEQRKVKSMQQVLSELGHSFNEMKIETETYSSGGRRNEWV